MTAPGTARPSLLPRHSTSCARSSPPTSRPAPRSSPAFRPSPTATCTSGTPRPSASTSASPASTAAAATCASTTPTRSRKTSSTWTRSRTTYAGSGSTGPTASSTRRTTTSGSTRTPRASSGAARPSSTRTRPTRSGPTAARLTEPGIDSPYRTRSADENLDLFRRMRAGEFADGAHVLRAKIDMASPNINMRDPVLYRIRHAEHHRTGTAWCIYPMYDYAHPLSDAYEGITHSLCTLEYEAHRPLYDWVVRECQVAHAPRQIEFARLNLNYTVMSKRKLLQLVAQQHVSRLGRPADADHLGPAAPRLHARVDPRLLQPRGRGQERERHRHRPARALRARRSEQARAARDGRAAAAEGRPHELPRGTERDAGRRQQPGGCLGGGPRGAVLARAVHRARRLHGRAAEEVLPAGARPRGASAQRLSHHLSGGGEGRGRRDRRAASAPTTRRRAAATPPMAARSRPRCTGCRPRTPWTARCGSTTASSRPRTRIRRRRRPARPFSTC